MNRTIILMLVLITSLSFLDIAVSSRSATLSTCDHSGVHTPVGMPIAFCWAACLEYLCDLYLDGFVTQGDFSYYACKKIPSNSCYSTNSGVIQYGCVYCRFHVCKCGLHPLDLRDLMGWAGFYCDPYVGGGYTPDELRNSICVVGNNLVTIYNNHTVVAVGYDNMNTADFNDDLVKWMDPNFSDYQVTSYQIFCYPPSDPYAGYGQINGFIPTWGFMRSADFRSYVSVADIQSFHAHLQGSSVRLDFEISAGADPNDAAAVYVSDNALGPGKLIPELVGTVALMPEVNTWYHSPISGSRYYYFLDHGGVVSDDKKVGGLRAASENPVYHSTGRPIFDAPSNLTVSEIVDRGNSFHLSWQLSQNDILLDCYHIYRKASGDSLGGNYEYLVSVPPGTGNFVDPSVDMSKFYSYKVSSAHHGYYSGPMTYQYGLFNDFSEATAPYRPIDELNEVTMSFPSGDHDTILVCPMGDADTITAAVTVRDSNGNPNAGLAANQIHVLVFEGGHFNSCSGKDTLFALHDTDENGRTEFRSPFASGCDSISLIGAVATRCSDNFLKVHVKSPDLNLDGVVDLSDLVPFGSSYNTARDVPPPPGHSFNPCCDFNNDDMCQLSDFALWGGHYQHACGGGQMMIAEKGRTPSSSVGVVLQMRRAVGPTDESRYYATVYLSSASNVSTLCLGLEAASSGLELIHWDPSANPAFTAVACPVVNRGKKLICMAIWSKPAFSGESVEVGTMEFLSRDARQIDLSDNPMSMVFGDVLESDGSIKRISSSTLESVERVDLPIANSLEANYPNPLNPSTVIEFSIAEDSRVNLSIFNVNGQLIRTLVNDFRRRNQYRIRWDGTDNDGRKAESGLYFYRLKSDSFSQTKKLVILR